MSSPFVGKHRCTFREVQPERTLVGNASRWAVAREPPGRVVRAILNEKTATSERRGVAVAYCAIERGGCYLMAAAKGN